MEDYKKGYTATARAAHREEHGNYRHGRSRVRHARDSSTPTIRRTGKRLWRFYTVPAPDELGGNTWTADNYKRGGASTWVTGTYDPETNLIFWALAIPDPISTETFAPATTYTRVVWWRSTPTRANSDGTTNSRLTMCTIGMPCRTQSR